LAGRDPAVQGIPLVRHQVRLMDLEEPAPEPGVAVPGLLLFGQAIDEDERGLAAVLLGSDAVEEALPGGGHRWQAPARGGRAQSGTTSHSLGVRRRGGTTRTGKTRWTDASSSAA